MCATTGTSRAVASRMQGSRVVFAVSLIGIIGSVSPGWQNQNPADSHRRGFAALTRDAGYSQSEAISTRFIVRRRAQNPPLLRRRVRARLSNMTISHGYYRAASAVNVEQS